MLKVINCLDELAVAGRIDRSKILSVHGDFFAHDFSPYDLFIFTGLLMISEWEKSERIVRDRLQEKLIQQMRKMRFLRCVMPGQGRRRLFPR